MGASLVGRHQMHGCQRDRLAVVQQWKRTEAARRLHLATMQPTQPRVWRKRAAPVAPEPAATATEIENIIDLTSSDQEKDSSAAPESDTASSPEMVEPQDEGSATILLTRMKSLSMLPLARKKKQKCLQ